MGRNLEIFWMKISSSKNKKIKNNLFLLPKFSNLSKIELFNFSRLH